MSKLLKKYTMFRPKILSRHPSHNILRSVYKKIAALPYKSVIRFGSTTDLPDTVSNGGNRIEINSIPSIKNSANKLLMKQKFTEADVKTAEWVQVISNNVENLKTWASERYPIVAKAHYGSKGKGNTLIKSQEELHQIMS